MDRGQQQQRLFLGVPLTDDLRRALASHLTEQLGRKSLPGKAPPPENWHITLRFLGNVSAAGRESLILRLKSAELGNRFELRFASLGAFPRPARASVLWIGIDLGAEPLCELARVTEDVAVGEGFAPENRAFHPHLTLSRIRPPQNLGDLVKSVPPLGKTMNVSEVALFRSHLRPDGARYERIERFPLRD